MQQQTTQPASPKSKFKSKRILYSVRIAVFVAMLLIVIITGAVAIMTGPISLLTILAGISSTIISVVTVLGVYSFFVREQTTEQQSAGQSPASNTTTVSPDNAQSGKVAQNASANLVSAQLATTQLVGNTVPTSPGNIQNGSVAQITGTKTGQPIFFFNLPLHDLNEFYGHKAARITLIARTANSGSSSIVGERRAGKTWLLTYLQLVAPIHNNLGSAYHIGCVSATHPQSRSLTNFVQWALEELKVPLSSYDPSLQPLDQLSRGVRTLKKQGTVPVLCIDEFEGFNNRQEFNVDFVEGLRAMTQSDGLVLVTVSKSPLKDLIEELTGQTSPLFNIVQQIPLLPFTKQEAQEFVNDKSNMASFTKKESDFFFNQSTLYSASGVPCWPPLRMQLVGQMLLERMRATQEDTIDKELD